MPTLYLLIGGNQGDRRQLLNEAADLIRRRIGSVVACSTIYETAPWGLFPPDETPQSFYNQALQAETPLPPHDALKEALDIEHRLGRRRREIENGELEMDIPRSSTTPLKRGWLPQLNHSNNQAIKQSSNHHLLPQLNYSNNQAIKQSSNQLYSSRPIDIDLIFYDNLVIDTPDLTLPHPRMHLRRFVLEPLCDIAPDYIHPIFNKSLTELLNECTDTSSCTPCC